MAPDRGALRHLRSGALAAAVAAVAAGAAAGALVVRRRHPRG